MRRQVPDHSPGSGPWGQAFAFAFQVKKTDDRPAFLCNQLDRLPLVALLLALDGVEKRGVEERQQAADKPATLVLLLIRTDHDTHHRECDALEDMPQANLFRVHPGTLA